MQTDFEAAIKPVDFSSMARTVLRLLHNRLGFALWMVTRTDAEDWIVLEAEDHGLRTPTARALSLD